MRWSTDRRPLVKAGAAGYSIGCARLVELDQHRPRLPTSPKARLWWRFAEGPRRAKVAESLPGRLIPIEVHRSYGIDNPVISVRLATPCCRSRDLAAPRRLNMASRPSFISLVCVPGNRRSSRILQRPTGNCATRASCTARGKGGRLLARPADKIFVGEIVRTLDGPLAPIACASRNFYRPCNDCPGPPSP